MLIPEPFPDELAYGHVGRIGYLNGLPSIKSTEQELKQVVWLKEKNAPWLSYAAKACGYTEEDYATRHTISPLMTAVYRMPSDRQWPPPGRRMLRRYGTLTKCRDGAFCPQCVKDDVRHYGVAYWHRIHCLPGLDWCVKHGLRLRQDERPVCFKFSPERCHDGEGHPVAKNNNPLITRYVSIMQSFLVGTKSNLLQYAWQALIKHMAIWSQSAPVPSGQSLKLRVLPALPPPWDFLRLGHIAPNELATLDRDTEEVFRQASAYDVGAYGLALAIAFRTTADAMAFHANIRPAARPFEGHCEGVIDEVFWGRASARRSSKRAWLAEGEGVTLPRTITE